MKTEHPNSLTEMIKITMEKYDEMHQFLTELIDFLNLKSELSIWEKFVLKRAKEIIKS